MTPSSLTYLWYSVYDSFVFNLLGSLACGWLQATVSACSCRCWHFLAYWRVAGCSRRNAELSIIIKPIHHALFVFEHIMSRRTSLDSTSRSHPSLFTQLHSPMLTSIGAVVLGAVNTNVCPAGSVVIASASACQSAAVATGRTYSGTTASASRPRGCYVFTTANTVWFNTDPAGGSLGTSLPLCSASTADSPSAVPDLGSTSPSPLVAPSGSTAAPLVAGTAAPSSAVRYCLSGTARCGTASCSGTWITTKAECELAAVALNAEAQTATLSTDAVQPRGCYLYRISTFLPVRTLRFNSAGTETSLLSNAWAICRLGGEGLPPAPGSHKQAPPPAAAAEESLQSPCLQPFVAAVEPHRFRHLDFTEP
jgi:hypothetical protein